VEVHGLESTEEGKAVPKMIGPALNMLTSALNFQSFHAASKGIL